MDEREELRHRFNRSFADWDIALPPDAMALGTVWLIVKQGWTIWARFDVGAEDGRERLDYYAMHRMTSDSHVRLYGDGSADSLPAMGDLGPIIPLDATPAEQEAAEEKYFAHNRAVVELLQEKGFVMTDDAHPSARLNWYLRTHPDAHRLP